MGNGEWKWKKTGKITGKIAKQKIKNVDWKMENGECKKNWGH